eukprot:1141022-Pelagomonas_calceolata.AAC.7
MGGTMVGRCGCRGSSCAPASCCWARIASASRRTDNSAWRDTSVGWSGPMSAASTPHAAARKCACVEASRPFSILTILQHILHAANCRSQVSAWPTAAKCTKEMFFTRCTMS